MNTDTNGFAERLEKMARDMEYPPLNGGPTQEEIIGALKAAAEVIDDYEAEESTNSENTDRVEELESAIEDLIKANHDNAKTFDEIITVNHDIAEELKKEQAKNAELQEEIKRLTQ